MVKPMHKHIARTATATSKRVKEGVHAKAELGKGEAAKQPSRTSKTKLESATGVSPSVWAESDRRKASDMQVAHGRPRNVESVHERDDDEIELDNLLQEGGHILPFDDV